MREPPTDLSPLPLNQFGTPSPLTATLLNLATPPIRYMNYDAGRRVFVFWESFAGQAEQLIRDINAGDPLVQARKFHRAYQEILSEKLRLDDRLRKAMRSDPRLNAAVGLCVNREATSVVPRAK
jgi:hypothetical protein